MRQLPIEVLETKIEDYGLGIKFMVELSRYPSPEELDDIWGPNSMLFEKLRQKGFQDLEGERRRDLISDSKLELTTQGTVLLTDDYFLKPDDSYGAN